MLNLRVEAMSREIGSFSQRLRAFENEMQERGSLSKTDRTRLNQIRQHKEQLEATPTPSDPGAGTPYKARPPRTGTLLS